VLYLLNKTPAEKPPRFGTIANWHRSQGVRGGATRVNIRDQQTEFFDYFARLFERVGSTAKTTERKREMLRACSLRVEIILRGSILNSYIEEYE